MQPHEERVIAEKREIDDKLAKLDAFCYNPGNPSFKTLPPDDRYLLEKQSEVMKQYSQILGMRIARFPVAAQEPSR